MAWSLLPRWRATRQPSSPSPATRRERHRLDDEDRSIGVDQVNHLDHSSASPATLNDPRLAAALHRPRPAGTSHDVFRFCPRNAMLGGVVEVPLDPAKVHRIII